MAVQPIMQLSVCDGCGQAFPLAYMLQIHKRSYQIGGRKCQRLGYGQSKKGKK